MWVLVDLMLLTMEVCAWNFPQLYVVQVLTRNLIITKRSAKSRSNFLQIYFFLFARTWWLVLLAFSDALSMFDCQLRIITSRDGVERAGYMYILFAPVICLPVFCTFSSCCLITFQVPTSRLGVIVSYPACRRRLQILYAFIKSHSGN